MRFSCAKHWKVDPDPCFGVKLVLSAAAPITELYDGERLRAEFGRNESRLIEMQSEEYLALEHRTE